MTEILTFNDLQNKITNLNQHKLIIKFTADWCNPCKTIQPLVNEFIQQIRNNDLKIIYYEINIDESIDLYIKFKKFKLLNGIPAIFLYDGNQTIDPEKWYIPHNSVLGANKILVQEFFNSCLT